MPDPAPEPVPEPVSEPDDTGIRPGADRSGDRRAAGGLVTRLSLGSRVGAMVAAAVGFGVALTALAGYLAVSGQLQRTVDDSLLDRAAQAAESTLGDPASIVTAQGEAILAADLRIALVRADGQAFSASGAESAPPLGTPEIDVARGTASQSVRTADLGSEEYRVVAVPSRPGLALVLGQSTEQTQTVLDTLRWVSIGVGGAGIVLAGWAGASIARAGLRPLRRLTDAAEQVASTGRLDPIEVTSTDEIGRLTSSFNAMLAAVRESQRRQSALVADAGHELRTPLTSMRTNLDLLAQNERQGGGLEPDERAQIVHDVQAQVTELSTLVGDLVELSRDDSARPSDENLDLADVVRDAVARVRLRAPSVAFSIDLRPWHVHGDQGLLGRAVTNLLDNAAKYSPAHGTVSVTLREGRLDVTDQGTGIAEEDLPHVFERFYRSTEARAHPGSGLGLAIVKAAAERHGGGVVAGHAPGGGAMLTMRIPGSSSPPLT